MNTNLPVNARKPHFWEALISLFALISGVTFSIVKYGLDPQVPMILGVIVACLIALRCGFKWKTIQNGMVKGISSAIPAVIILIVVGIMVGVWILAGVVPAIIYYGLEIISPTFFLPATLIICALTSVATGTSWGTTATVGVALIGIGGGLGFPLPLVAGAVLSGAYFGDKLSPLSDTTNIASAMVGIDVFKHVKHMSYTTSVTFGLTLLIEIVIGFTYDTGPGNLERIEHIQSVLAANFSLNPIIFSPILLIVIISYFKVPAIPGITIGALAGVVCAVLVQGADYQTLIQVSSSGFESITGDPDVDALLTRGGLDSMMFAISLIFTGMMFGGVMERTSQLLVVAEKILNYARSTGSLVATTAITCVAANIILCDQYMAIIMGARSFSTAYKEKGLAPENLSRAVEDSATVTANLVPWNAGGAYQAATLGVPTFLYLPFNFYCWLSPLVTILFAYMGWTMTKLPHDHDAESQRSKEHN
ncbi:Na+/H+ antiporter NhaC [Marinomonas sp. 15G1-11]|uniref:Na+/H+ antiporter NhaC n=1 Tax=Marinomonas phaeophyticola TaxID=3004091 RepID=A0ABT4JX10_9GAMM|nr:Na+/H+ antiporter NhaC [Marinomonas sp. 15G1-11]MCZ2722922.1 Na+/H+ antiporter NhaC [Marinomonas sp. 15G1-11]